MNQGEHIDAMRRAEERLTAEAMRTGLGIVARKIQTERAEIQRKQRELDRKGRG